MEVAINFDDLAQVETLSTTASKVLVKLNYIDDSKFAYLFIYISFIEITRTVEECIT